MELASALKRSSHTVNDYASFLFTLFVLLRFSASYINYVLLYCYLLLFLIILDVNTVVNFFQGRPGDLDFLAQ